MAKLAVFLRHGADKGLPDLKGFPPQLPSTTVREFQKSIQATLDDQPHWRGALEWFVAAPDGTLHPVDDWNAQLSSLVNPPTTAKNTITFILKPPMLVSSVAGPEAPACVVGGGVSTAVQDVKSECDFSAASGAALYSALRHLGLDVLPILPPDNVKRILFEPFPWPVTTVNDEGVKAWISEPSVVLDVRMHANRLLKRAKIPRMLQDIRESISISPLEVTFEAYGKRCRYEGYLDLGLFTTPSPNPAVTGPIIGGIQLKTPEQIAGYNPSDLARRSLPKRALRFKPETQGIFEAMGAAVYTGRCAIPILVTDFCTTGRIFALDGEAICDYRMLEGDEAVVMDAHTAWNVWLHLVEPVAVALKELNARKRAAPNPVLKAREEFYRDRPIAGYGLDDSANCGAGEPPAKRARVNKHRGTPDDAMVAGGEDETVDSDDLERQYAQQVLRDAMRHVIF